MSVVTTLATPVTVRVEADGVVFDRFIETDQHVVDTIRSAADPERCAHELLHLGAHLAGLAVGSGGLAELEARVGDRLDTLAGAAQATVAAGLATLAEQSRALLGSEDGEVATVLRAWRSELDAHLGQLFDPDHKRSVIAAIETSLRGVLDTYSRRLASAFDPDETGSPAARLLAQAREDASGLKAELAALTMAVGVDRGRADEHDRTAVKGLEFEPAVLAAVTVIAAPHGDLVEHVGRTTGARATKKGDILVTVTTDDLGPAAGLYVVEAKNRRLTLAATWRELDAAMANWEARAAVAVFAAGDLAPTELPFWYSDDKAIVVLDRDEPDPAALALACLFARWVVRRHSSQGDGGPDVETMAGIIARMQRDLARVSTIRRSLSTAAKATGEARAQLDTLAGEIRDGLGELAALLEER